MTVPPTVVKMKVFRHLSAAEDNSGGVNQPLSTDGSDKRLYDGNFESFDDDQELYLIPKKTPKNKWATVLRWTLYSLVTCVVLSTVYFIVDDVVHVAYIKKLESQHLTAINPVVSTFDDDDNDTFADQCSKIPEGYGKFDCFPDAGKASEEGCIRRGCCWVPLEKDSPAPWCFYPAGFSYYNWSMLNATDYGATGQATLQSIYPSPYPNPLTQLQVDVYFETENTVRVKIFSPTLKRYEVPLSYEPPKTRPKNINYQVVGTAMGPRIQRVGGSPLFDPVFAPIIFNDQFLELTTSLNAHVVYGPGVVVDSLARSTNWSRTVLFNHDSAPAENNNLYSTHPILLALDQRNGQSHGIFLLNSNAMEIVLQKHQGGLAATFRSIGGILDFRIFLGPNPADVVKQYTDVIGKPFLPPYWSLGYHLCRFNYGTLNHTAEILDKNLAAGIPVEVQWNDLDYMNNRNDFSYDPTKFSGLPEFVKSLHKRGMRYIPLIDPGISASEPEGTYPPYDEGIAADIFVKNHAGRPFLGKVWNTVSTVWPDFSHPNATHYWMTQIDRFHKDVEIDGAWIDMNDPSNFYDGEIDGCPKDSNLDNPPYVPHVEGGKLCFRTLCMSAQQYAGRHYDVHNMYSYYETIATYKALGDITSERPFVISRSSFPGQGHYGGVWTGDVFSTWKDMRGSIPQILTYGLFGIPMVGADICGFNGNTTTDLCKRWQQLGAFYPFMRNHNTDDGIPQDPASLGPEVVGATKETLLARYYLLPYLYSMFVLAHKTGEPVARPMFYDFNKEPETYRLQEQFMLGPSVLVAPILTENFNESSLKVYLPRGYWYSHYSMEPPTESFGEYREAAVPKDSLPIFYRGGSIIVAQQPGNTTKESRKNKFDIRVHLAADAKACGVHYWDDGVSNAPFVTGNYNEFQLTATNNDLKMSVAHAGYTDAEMYLGYVQVRGVRGNVSNVVLNNVDFAFKYDTQTNVLELKNLTLDMKEGFTLKWNTLPYET